MTTDLDRKVGPKVAAVIAKYGKTVTFTVIARVNDEATGAVTKTPTPFPNIKVTPPTLTKRWKNRDIVEGGMATVLLAAKDLAFTPALASQITMDDVAYAIVDIDEHYSGDDIAAYEFLIKTT